MSEHTPGPLSVVGPSRGGSSYDDGGDYAIVDAHNKIIGEASRLVGPGGETRPALENARLWAAAPDLLAACEAEEAKLEHFAKCGEWPTCFSDECGGGPCDIGTRLMHNARQLRQAAIAKAKGVA